MDKDNDYPNREHLDRGELDRDLERGDLDRGELVRDREDYVERHEDTFEQRDDVADAEFEDRNVEREGPSVTGDVLGISQVPTGPTGEIRTPERGSREEGAHQHEDHVLPLEDEEDLGARDVTKNGRGQTGPETGGHGSTPRRSGATGMDIG